MSKFDKLFEARESEDNEKPPAERKAGAAKKKAVKPAEKPAQEVAQSNTADASQSHQQKKRGRPQAKRSDPDFIGFTTYIRKDTHRNVKIALLQDSTERELSELVEELLSKWLKNK